MEANQDSLSPSIKSIHTSGKISRFTDPSWLVKTYGLGFTDLGLRVQVYGSRFTCPYRSGLMGLDLQVRVYRSCLTGLDLRFQVYGSGIYESGFTDPGLQV